MSKYFEKLAEESSNLDAKKLELEGISGEHSILFHEVSALWQKYNDTRNDIKHLEEDLEYFELGYKKLFSDHFDEAKANWGLYLFVFVIFAIVSGIVIVNDLLPLAISIAFPFVGTLLYDVVNFLENDMVALKRINKLRKEKTKEGIESEISAKETEKSKQMNLYDERQKELHKVAVKKSELGSLIYNESTRLAEFRKKCEAGYNAALKEFIENMTPEQKAKYEIAIDLNIASQLESVDVGDQGIGARVQK